MDDLIGALHEQSPLFLTREEFEKSLEGWTFDPVYKDGEMVGVFLVNGPEFHFAILGPVTATKAHLKKYPGSLIERYGYALTKTPKSDTRQLRFNQRAGFVQVGEDEFDYHLRIDALRQKKVTSCPSSQ